MDHELLLNLAHDAIHDELYGRSSIDTLSLQRDNEFLSEERASFVTLNLDGRLRGCIGSLLPQRKLIDDVMYNAKAAAFQDYRFQPLSKDELANVDIEISIAFSASRVIYESIDELKEKIKVGIDGVILEKDHNRATFLPQVWEQLPTFELFFEHLCQKAGLCMDCLKQNPTIQVYQVEKNKTMTYYKKDGEYLTCLLCHHYCKLKPQQTGLCGVNKHTGEKIECLVYGHISALNIDPIEKKPLYHFLPQSQSLSLGTVGCNFKCSFCQNWGDFPRKKN